MRPHEWKDAGPPVALRQILSCDPQSRSKNEIPAFGLILGLIKNGSSATKSEIVGARKMRLENTSEKAEKNDRLAQRLARMPGSIN
jgi:hypothetical protein